MSDWLQPELRIVAALRLASPPPEAWIEAAAQIPDILGELDRLEGVVNAPEFRRRFASDPAQALDVAGLPAAPRLVAAIRERLELAG